MTFTRSFSCAAAVAVFASATGGANSAVADCFCLAHPVTTEIVHYGCEAWRIPNRVSERVTCLLAERRGRGVVGNHQSFERVDDGVDACNPCAPPPDGDIVDVPRRPGEAQQQVQE